MKRFLLLFVLLFSLVSVSPSSIAAGNGGLSITLTQVETKNGQVTITVSFDNTTEQTISIGWVNSGDIQVETTTGTYSAEFHSIRDRIEPGASTLSVQVPNCAGEILSITFVDLQTLDSRGLPDTKLGSLKVDGIADISTGVIASEVPDEPTPTQQIALTPAPETSQPTTGSVSTSNSADSLPSAEPTQSFDSFEENHNKVKDMIQQQEENMKKREEEHEKAMSDFMDQFHKVQNSSSNKSEETAAAFEKRHKIVTYLVYLVEGVVVIALLFSVVSLIRGSSIRPVKVRRTIPLKNTSQSQTQEDDIKRAGRDGENDVEHHLQWWVRDNPECRLVKRDCRNKDGDACIRLRLPGTNDSQEIDHILIGPFGVLHIETKNYSGAIRIKSTTCWERLKNGATQWETIESPAFQVSRHETVLKKIVGDEIKPIGIICIANANATLDGIQNSEIPVVPIFNLSQSLDHILQLARSRGYHEDVNALYDKINAAKMR